MTAAVPSSRRRPAIAVAIVIAVLLLIGLVATFVIRDSRLTVTRYDRSGGHWTTTGTSDSLLYGVGDYSLRIIDVSGATPVRVSSMYNESFGTGRVAYGDGVLYWGTSNDGLIAVDVSDPVSPSPIGTRITWLTWPLNSTPESIYNPLPAVYGKVLLLGGANAPVLAGLDVRDPSYFREHTGPLPWVFRINLTAPVRAVKVFGDLAFITESDGILLAFDLLTTPPREIARMDTGALIYDLDFDGRQLALPDYPDGILHFVEWTGAGFSTTSEIGVGNGTWSVSLEGSRAYAVARTKGGVCSLSVVDYGEFRSPRILDATSWDCWDMSNPIVRQGTVYTSEQEDLLVIRPELFPVAILQPALPAAMACGIGLVILASWTRARRQRESANNEHRKRGRTTG